MNKHNTMQVRGIHLDLKAQMMKFSSICDVVKDASRWGYNTILLEYQDKFPYEGELAVLSAPDALTKSEILELSGLCKTLGVSIIPLLQCLGHEYWVLRHKQFSHLAEGVYPDIGYGREFCPSEPESIQMFKKMARQVLGLHSDCQYFHLGGDEVTLFKECEKCSDFISKAGKGRLLAEYYGNASEFISSCGHVPVLWSDMLLAYPETLDLMKDKAVLMDWDYWSTTEPGYKGLVWGARGLEKEPDKWPDAHQKLVKKYIYKDEPYLFNQFPYLPFLKERGYRTITAPAARCSGDACFIPKNMHVDNCIQAVISAVEADNLGVVVTSWAVRRVPWALTEYSLIASALKLRDPDISREEIDCTFCTEHFGIYDSDMLSAIIKLADAASEAMKQADILSSAQDYPDMKTGHFFARDYDKRLKNIVLTGNKNVADAYNSLKHAAVNARNMLGKARPDTDKSRYRTELWLWAAETAEFFGGYVPLLTLEKIPYAMLEKAKEALLRLAEQNEKLLFPIYTDFTMISEYQMRTGVHLDFMERLLAE